jgi:CHASE3 domain sensor protein
MGAYNGFTSLAADRKITIKVAMGFTCGLAILAVVSGTAYFSFESSAEGFITYTQRVTVVGIAPDIDRTFLTRNESASRIARRP